MKQISAIAVLVALSACKTVGAPQDPAQTVYAAKGTFAAALVVANTYKGLPACGGTAVVCSDPTVVARIRQDAAAANAALNSAEAVVTAPGASSSDIATAVQLAASLASSFSSETSALKVK